ncbi:MAG: TetR/AcrR family transcriptional regulator [Mycolicibacterium sp.]|uniref:TetR/AcrR family transcriptional regulator n=1 Tax=Mycolicibacterium sp. TaxID=2320850 RepID=UPI000FA79C07|nr:TetR family transcriptional regulator [Mycolicibacterium sp.]RUP26996.1 MAG: TetR/AcrR family transcriptional regulator [Mycolicibacterium sp.]
MTTPTRRQMYAAATRAALLEAACDSFVGHGYAATAIEEVTATARISKGAFYRHFPDKQTVFVELFSERLRQAAAAIEDTVTAINAAGPGNGALLASKCAYDFAARSVTDPVHRELMRQAPEVLGEQKYLALDDELVLPSVHGLLTTLSSFGELRPDVPLDTTARLLLRVLCAANTLIANADDPRAALAESAITMSLFFAGLTPPTRQSEHAR